MSYCAIQSRLGGFKKQEFRDYETTHIIMDVDEWDEMQRRLDTAQKKLKEEQDARRSDRARMQQNAEYEQQAIMDETAKQIDAYKDKVAHLEEEIKSKEYLYGNMKRIMRENANRDRNLRPKKQHAGYVVLQSRQSDFSYMNGRSRETVKIWITTLQSFYDASIPINQARREIEKDLKGHVLGDLGFSRWTGGDPDGEYRTFEDDDGNEVNGLFRWRYNSNYKSGYWELFLYHTKSIIVPEEYRRAV